MDGTQLVVVQLTKGNSHKARCRERLHCKPKRCNLPDECLSGGKLVTLEEARGFQALTYCGACLTTEARATLRLPDRCQKGLLLEHAPEPARRPQAAMVADDAPAQSPSASVRDCGQERRPLRQNALLTWSLELAQREAKLKKGQLKLAEDQQILNAGRKELADHAEELRLGELRMAWLREEVVRVEKQVEEAKKRRRLLDNDLRILDKRLEQERQRLMDIDERRQESVLALHAAQRQNAEHVLVIAGDDARTEEPSRAPPPQVSDKQLRKVC